VNKCCTQCKVEKPITDFRLDCCRAVPRRLSECLDCIRARQRAIYHRRQRLKATGVPATPEEEHAKELNKTAAQWRGPVNRHQPLRLSA